MTHTQRRSSTTREAVARLRRWSRRASPHAVHTYHTGNLALDRSEDPIADAVAHEAARLCGAGYVHLVQRRRAAAGGSAEPQSATLGHNLDKDGCTSVINDYICVRTRRPMPGHMEDIRG